MWPFSSYDNCAINQSRFKIEHEHNLSVKYRWWKIKKIRTMQNGRRSYLQVGIYLWLWNRKQIISFTFFQKSFPHSDSSYRA